MTTPRLRPELSATPTEEQGIKFFDVSDPRSGNKMRLYDFEWLLASQMDGRRSHDELAQWARGALQLDLSGDAVAEYATRLAALGFFAASEPEMIPAPTISRREEYSGSSVTPLPPPSPGSDSEEITLNPDDEITIQREALPPREARVDPTEKTAPSPVYPDAPRGDATVPNVALPREEPAPRPLPPAPARATGPAAAVEPEKSGKGSMIGLVLILLVIAAVVAYVTLFSGGGGGVKVSVTVAKPGDVVRLHDGVAKLDKAAPSTLAFGEGGKVVDVVAAGTEVKAGQALATLDGYTKVEKEIADVKDRLGFYQKQLEAATQKGEAEAQRSAEGKVAEKKKLLGDLEQKARRLRLVAPSAGVVDKVHVAAGGEAKAEAPAIELTEKHAAAVFTVDAASAAALKAGDEVTLQPAAGGPTVTARVGKVEGDKVTVEAGDDTPGGDFRLVKTRLPGVVTLPASAVAKKDGAEVVYVLAEGAVHQRPVKIAERTAGEVYVASGLKPGEQVVSRDVTALADGQKAAAQ